MNTAASIAPARHPGWLKTLHQWHWISSAVCLMGMLLFAVTGITLNHAADIGSKPEVSRRQAVLPEHAAAGEAALESFLADLIVDLLLLLI